MLSAVDHHYMSTAIALAKQGLHTTMPNPRVGCVIVRHASALKNPADADAWTVVGQGFHEQAGEPHAEIHALTQAAEYAEGATAYVTLEPCSHFGRTPPCATALINAGVARVVIAMKDPNPVVAGRGIALLEDAGVKTTVGVLASEALAVNRGFVKRMRTGRPWVRAKLAMSLDGRTAMKSGESQWITGPEARADVQKLRAQSCAIITGVSSILHDDSSLTVRAHELNLPNAEQLVRRQPLRVVLDAYLKTPPDANVVKRPGHCLIIASGDASEEKRMLLEEAGAEVRIMDACNGRIELQPLLDLLGQRECNEVLLETGATLAGAMVEHRLVDELIIFMAPTLMGSDARPLLTLPFRSMGQKRDLTIQDIRAVGRDWKLTIAC